MSTTTYNVDDLIAGDIITDQVKVLADTYYRGMPLKYNTGTDRYEYSATAGEVVAVWLEDERIVAANDSRGSVILGGEVNGEGLVNDSGAKLTVTDAIRARAAQVGLYIKR
jgi:hypothetical protein